MPIPLAIALVLADRRGDDDAKDSVRSCACCSRADIRRGDRRRQSRPTAPPRGPGGYVWQGPYVGANLGYQWGSINNNPANPSGVAGGVQAGYNVQYGQFVFGGETDLQVTGANDTFASWKFSNPWFGTLRARAGVAMNNVLFYGTVGLAYGTLKMKNTLTGVSESHTSAGWAGGAGVEVGADGRTGPPEPNTSTSI